MSKYSKLEPICKKKEENTIKAKAKFNGLKVWPADVILRMCQISYPQLKLEKVIGFTEIKKSKSTIQTFIVEGTVGNLEIYDAG